MEVHDRYIQRQRHRLSLRLWYLQSYLTIRKELHKTSSTDLLLLLLLLLHRAASGKLGMDLHGTVFYWWTNGAFPRTVHTISALLTVTHPSGSSVFVHSISVRYHGSKRSQNQIGINNPNLVNPLVFSTSSCGTFLIPADTCKLPPAQQPGRPCCGVLFLIFFFSPKLHQAQRRLRPVLWPHCCFWFYQFPLYSVQIKKMFLLPVQSVACTV